MWLTLVTGQIMNNRKSLLFQGIMHDELKHLMLREWIFYGSVENAIKQKQSVPLLQQSKNIQILIHTLTPGRSTIPADIKGHP